MLIDVNAYIGHYPFRKTENKSAYEFVSLMKEYELSRACVSSLNGIYYRDVMQGNYELLEEIKPYLQKLIPICVINPVYAHAKEDLCECIEKLGFKGVRLFPKQHQYSLDCEKSVEILKLAGEYGVPVQLPLYLEDLRQRHPMDIMDPVSLQELKSAALLADKTNFILSNFDSQLYCSELEKIDHQREGSFYYDIGRIDCLTQDSFAEVLKSAGYDHLLFGTGAPLQYIDVQLVKLAFLPQTLGTKAEKIEAIQNINAKKLFQIDG